MLPPVVSSESWKDIGRLFQFASDVDENVLQYVLESLSEKDRGMYSLLKCLIEADSNASTLIPPSAGIRLSVERASAPDLHTEAYHLEDVIACGGTALVYRATRVETGTTVAVKVPRERFPSKARIQLFMREQHMLERLQHVNIIQLLDVSVVDENTPCLVTEYVAGCPITEFVQGVSLREGLRLFLDLCAAVEYVHGHHIVHCDIKPLNVLVTPDRTVKLLDFGAAEDLRKGGGTERKGGAMTPSYGAPEQANSDNISRHTDIYALGILLREIVLHTRPLVKRDEVESETISEADNDASVSLPHRPDVSSSNVGRCFPKELDAICSKASRTDPRKRHESIRALQREIRGYLSGPYS